MFNNYTIKDVIDEVIDYRGKTPKKLGGDWSEEKTEYMALSAKNIKKGRIVQPDKIRYVDQDIYSKWMKQEVERGTIIITSEAPFGELLYWDSDDKIVLSQRLFGLKIKKEFNSRYIYYYMFSDQFQGELSGRATGSTVTGLRQPELLKCHLKVPNRKNQDIIANILINIDKKINLNNEINNNLHEYAKELFKNWFIDFNYPNSNEDRIESELGLIPKGWSIGYFDDGLLTEIIKSGVSKFDGEKKYIATADVDDSSINSYTVVDYNSKPSRANMTPIANSIWFAKMEGSKKNILVTNYTKELIDDYIFSTGFMGIKCLNNSTNYLWEIINSEQFQLKKDSLSTGTLMAGVSNTTIKNYKYLIPTKDVLDNYNEVITSINKKIYNNQVENKKLSQLRDTLLPKLMNGEIDLDNIEI